MHREQPDLFGDDQPALFDEDAAPVQFVGDPDRARARLNRILAEARAAESQPWDDAKLSLYRTIFPQMTNWLPDEEAQQLLFEFAEELQRLKAA